jgi:type I restriction enzyme M protein
MNMTTTQMKLPNWLEHRHSLLWDSFKDATFKMDDAVKVLEEKNHDKRDEVPVFLSELRKAGWLKAELDPNDARKTIYTLKSKEEIIGDLFTVKQGELTRSDIEGLLKKAADLIRTRVDYKFILILLF